MKHALIPTHILALSFLIALLLAWLSVYSPVKHKRIA
jgi:hypothetical protein